MLVILAGSVVRASGSGMGCPDWPTCFGQYIPPTSEDQVMWHASHDYRKGQIIVHQEALWVAQTDFISGETFNAELWEVYTKHDYAVFNPVHTWVEFVNRLLTVLLGIPAIIAFVMTWRSYRQRPWAAWLMTSAMAILLFESWLGKLVVEGHLVPNQITYHMTGAFVLVGVLVWLRRKLSPISMPEGDTGKRINQVLGVVTLLMMAQIIMGSQVREGVDELMKVFGADASRVGWIDMLSNLIYVHRSASLLVIAGAWWMWRMGKSHRLVNHHGLWILGLLIGESVLGALMFYVEIPKFLQPAHLVMSAMVWWFIVDLWAASFTSRRAK